tara:strand:+ start:2015 stop:2230 length:216 start_codon:yes stop_codon:yes gene_type:complete
MSEVFMLTMLETGKEVAGTAVIGTDDGVVIETKEGRIPVYMFKMTNQLHRLLARDREEWDVAVGIEEAWDV